jgi:double-strand break repair protein AddB
MEAIAALPQGALVLPGFDFYTPAPVWGQMDDVLTAEDHPQYRFRRIMERLSISPEKIRPWTDVASPSTSRNALVSLALRPAPVTDQWLQDGPALTDLRQATADVTLIEAPSARIEALAIALVLREAADRGVTAALITPDRNLSRQVTAALDRWAILPDDSAGRPLGLSPPGRLLRQIAGLFGEKLTSDKVLALLKHPLTASGGARGPHLRFTRELELSLRKYGPAFPTAESLELWAKSRPEPEALAWAQFVAEAIGGLETVPKGTLLAHVELHLGRAERLARGTIAQGAGALWEMAAGQEALRQMQTLLAEAPYGGHFSAAEYDDLFTAFLSKGEVREPLQSHPNIMIWGTLEARVQGADLVILGGLNDGVWPGLPDPDPWLNRRMRKDAGLLLPEREIGLSAHDFQQAIAAPQVVLSRSSRDAEAETVPSRWLNRLFNLMSGLPDNHGPEALRHMTEKGDAWLRLAHAMEQPTDSMKADPRLLPARRPAPQPPVTARPDRLSLTRISTLIRDPYAIYAKYILRLTPLDPLRATPDPRDRGTIFHDILQRFVLERPISETRSAARDRLLDIADQVLATETPFPAARVLWRARMERAAEHFLTQDGKHGGVPIVVETKGTLAVESTGFTLFGIPDRIDRLPDGRLHLIDYKTGTPPTPAQQDHFDKQLRLTAALVEKGGFTSLGAEEVALISYIGLGAGQKVEDTPRDDLDLDSEWDRFVTLITRYAQRQTGYVARRALFEDRFDGDYDHLSRYGEWQMSDRAVPEPVGPVEAGK